MLAAIHHKQFSYNLDLDFFRFLKNPRVKDLIRLGFKLKWRFLNTLIIVNDTCLGIIIPEK